MESFLKRTQLLLGEEAMNRLKNAHVAIFGLGGVGGYVAEALVRSGVFHFTLFDHDVVDITNLNRQIFATTNTLSQPKVLAAKERMLSINPEAHIVCQQCFFSEKNASDIDFSTFSYVVDAIDSVSSKLLLIETAKHYNVPIMSSMGAGNKLNPTQFCVADIYETSICPLAKVVRKELRKRGVTHLKVVYSKELPIPHKETLVEIGSVAFVPSVAGLIIASEVVKELSQCNQSIIRKN